MTLTDAIQINNTWLVFEILVIEEFHCWSQIIHQSMELVEMYRFQYVRKLALTSQRIDTRYHANSQYLPGFPDSSNRKMLLLVTNYTSIDGAR
jgi:hypothetical protein